jgi:hypothetical protein
MFLLSNPKLAPTDKSPFPENEREQGCKMHVMQRANKSLPDYSQASAILSN